MIHILILIFSVGFGASIAVFMDQRRYAEAAFVFGLAGILLMLLGYAAGTFGETP